MNNSIRRPEAENDQMVMDALQALHNRRLGRARQELENAKEEIELLYRKIQQIAERHAVLVSELEDRQARLDVSERRIGELEARQQELPAVQRDIRRFMLTIADREQRLAFAIENLKLSEQKIAELSDALDAEKAFSTDAVRESAAVERQVSMLQLTLADRDERLRQLRLQEARLARTLGEVQASLAAAERESRAHVLTIADREARIAGLRARLEQAVTAIDVLHHERNVLHRRSNALHLTLADREYRMGQLQAQPARDPQLDEELDRARSDIALLEASLDSLRLREGELLDERAHLTEELDSANASMANIQRRYEEKWRKLERDWLAWEPLVRNLTPKKLSAMLEERTKLRTQIEELKKSQSTMNDIVRHLTEQSEHQGVKSAWKDERRTILSMVTERDRRIFELEHALERFKNQMATLKQDYDRQDAEGEERIKDMGKSELLASHRLEEMQNEQANLLNSIRRLQDLIIDLESRLARTETRMLLRKAEEDAKRTVSRITPLIKPMATPEEE